MIKVAIVGTGGMAHAHARAYKEIKGCKIVAGVDIDRQRAQQFCEHFDIPAHYGSVDELLAHCDFDAASVVTSDPFHVPCALPLVKAGKHVLCEKPIAPTAREAQPLVLAAEKKGVINMINFSYRNAPVLHAAAKCVRDGNLGDIRHFEANYLQTWLTSDVWGHWKTSPQLLWRLSSRHGSKGALGDIGVHIVDMATYVVGAPVKSVNARVKTLPKVKGNRIGEYVLDANDSAYIRAELRGGAIGMIQTTRWATGQINTLSLAVYGTCGALRLNLDRSYDDLEVCLGEDVQTATWKTVKSKKTPTMYQRFITSIRTGKNDDCDFRRGWMVQKMLDASFVSSEKDQTIPIR